MRVRCEPLWVIIKCGYQERGNTYILWELLHIGSKISLILNNPGSYSCMGRKDKRRFEDPVKPRIYSPYFFLTFRNWLWQDYSFQKWFSVLFFSFQLDIFWMWSSDSSVCSWERESVFSPIWIWVVPEIAIINKTSDTMFLLGQAVPGSGITEGCHPKKSNYPESIMLWETQVIWRNSS